jgi:hypothetical protein
MWSKEGIKYFKRVETEWKKVYKDGKLMMILYSYSEWEGWLEKKGIEMMLEKDLEITLHSVMAMWTDEDDAKNKGVEKGNDIDSKNCPSASRLGEEEEEGCNSDMDLRK